MLVSVAARTTVIMNDDGGNPVSSREFRLKLRHFKFQTIHHLLPIITNTLFKHHTRLLACFLQIFWKQFRLCLKSAFLLFSGKISNSSAVQLTK